MNNKLVWAPVLALVFSNAQAELLWQTQPPVPQAKRQAQHAGGHMNHRRGGKAFYLGNTDGARIELWAPTLKRQPLSVEGEAGKVAVKGIGFDNYHALVASREAGGVHESALRYVYMHGKPSGHSPRELVETEKLPLEIVPQPLIREHRRYQSQEQAVFEVRYRGQPLAGQPISLESANGTRLYTLTDAQGQVSFTLPDDFRNVRPGRSNNRPQDFVIRTAHSEGGTQYRTSFSMPYYVNPSHWASNNVGLFMLAAGFVSGLVVLRVGREHAPQKGRARA